MKTSLNRPLDYRCFLLGILVYWMFDIIWTSFSRLFFFGEDLCSPINPIAVIIGKSILTLVVTYLVFRKFKILNIKWIHLVIIIIISIGLGFLNTFLFDWFFNMPFDYDNHTISQQLLFDVRKWANLITSFLVIAFIWWRCHPDVVDADTGASSIQSYSYYGGVLFFITFEYLLSLVDSIESSCLHFFSNTMLLEIVLILIAVAIIAATFYIIAKKRIVVPPLTAILTVVAVQFACQYYLSEILRSFLTTYPVMLQTPFYPLLLKPILFLVLFLTVFILYRREMKKAITEEKSSETSVQ